MYISSIININNYRNLAGLSFEFEPTINYLIGENNLGKTNILELINTLLSIGKFSEADFNNIEESIIVVFTVAFSQEEIGFFEDYFDISNQYKVTIRAEQESIDDRITYYHNEAGDVEISGRIIKRINTLYYYSQRIPSAEMDFRKNSGSGRTLHYLIQQSLDSLEVTEKDIIEKTKLDGIVSSINTHISSLNSITGDSIKAYYDENCEDVICRILGLGDADGHSLTSLGDGIQYAFNIVLQIMEAIYKVKRSRKDDTFIDRLIERDNKHYFPIILILDEPEIHQHPYRQRSLIKKILEVFENRNQTFINLLKELYGIDGLCGQLFIATHSPNILLNDYQQFIRIFRTQDNTLSSVSGRSIQLEDDLYKHLLHNYVYLKEAMFSRAIIFVEGDTENGALPVFANRLDIDLDSCGIGIIKLDGADSVKRCLDLYNRFGIKCVAILDKDKEPDYKDIANVFFTNSEDFEADIYDNFNLCDYLHCCSELKILNNWINPLKREGIINDVPEFLKTVKIPEIDPEKEDNLLKTCRDKQLKALRNNKNANNGAILARYVTAIPESFSTVLCAMYNEVKKCL